MSTLFVVWFAGFAFHLAIFAAALGVRGIEKDISSHAVLYAALMLLALAMAWPLFVLLYAARYARGER